MSDLANQPHQKPLENAVEIIERFGGIRPMASKVNIAVTTIQGWKKRGVIPANRIETVISCASIHGIQIADLIHGDLVQSASIPMSAPNENLKAQYEKNGNDDTVKVASKETNKAVRHDDTYERIKAEQTRLRDLEASLTAQAAKKAERTYTELRIDDKGKKIPKSAYVTMGVVLLALAAVIGILVPKKTNHNEGQQELAYNSNTQETEFTDDNNFKGIEEESWSSRFADLKDQASQAAQGVGETIGEVQQDIINSEIAQEGVAKIEEYVGSNFITDLAGRYANMGSTEAGQSYLNESMSALHGMVMGKGSDTDLAMSLDEAIQSNPSLSETFTGVPRQDLKAAAMLLAMTQVRDTLNRSKVPFEKDMQTLKGLVGDEDAELAAALDKLAPKAEQGILTPTGMSNEFRSLAGDMLSASLNGEDLSLVERARSRMNDVFEVEKGGESLTDSEQQKIMNEAREKLNKGKYKELQAYIDELLKAQELDYLRPWLNKLKAKVDKLIPVLEKVQKEIYEGDLKTAIDLLKKQLNVKELDAIRPWMKKADSLLSQIDLTDLQRELEKSIQRLKTAFGRVRPPMDN